MTQPTGSQRTLNYPLNRNEDMESTTPSDTGGFLNLEDWSSNDPDERVDIILNLSLNEYVAIASCIDVGRDIAYGDNSLQLWWIWVRALTSMTLCQSIIDCINSTPELQTAIQNTVAGNIETTGQPSRIDSDTFDVLDCDNDVIYGYSKALWEYINEKNRDFLQIMAEAANESEQIALLIRGIPLFNQLPIDEVFDWIAAFGDYNLEAYDSSLTVGLEQEIICDIFCIAVENECSLTLGLVYDYMIEKLGGVNAPTAFATFAEFVLFMATGDYPTDRIVYLWTCFQLAMAFVGAEFLGTSGIEQYALFAQAGDPDNEWSLLCDPCNSEWEYIVDFRLDENETLWTTIDPSYPPTWVFNQGLIGAKDSLGARGGIYFSFAAPVHLTSVETSNNQQITAANTRAIGWRIYDDNVYPLPPAIHSNLLVSDADGIVNVEEAGDWEDILLTECYFGCRAANGFSKIEQVIFKGVGYNPFA